jgi:DNA-binding response OmpR family regulator
MTNRAPCVLSVSYDESLLRTREWILEGAGFAVTSALGFTEAIAHCQNPAFDLAIIGHSIPKSDRNALVNQLRQHNHTRILALRRPGDEHIPEVDHFIEPSLGPDALLEAVRTTLARPRSSRSEV